MKFDPLHYLAWVILLVPVQFATAQTASLKQTRIDYSVSSGGQPEALEQETVIFDHLVEIEDALWIRLGFTDVVLEPGSYLLMTSVLDAAWQRLTAETLAQWGNTSAYFNGSQVHVQLFAGARNCRQPHRDRYRDGRDCGRGDRRIAVRPDR